jgi:hypothetical protein
MTRQLSFKQLDGEQKLTIQAFFRGTMWSISTSDAAVQVAPSKGEYHVPEVAAQAELVTTLTPSRFRTYSLLRQSDCVLLRISTT